MNDQVISLADKLQRARERLGVPSAPSAPEAPKGLLHVDSETRVEFGRSEQDRVIDDAIDSLSILDAYARFCGKMTPNPGKKRDGIMISCPNPSHPDKNPSAWINLDKETWYCPGCDQGGDKYDIAAWYFGMPVPGYKDGENFHILRKKIAEDRGVSFVQTMTGKLLPVPPAPPEPPRAESAPIVEPVEEPLATVTSITENYDDTEEIPQIELDWREIVPPQTFLDIWMRQTTIDDVPEEYHFWNGMVALGMALGRDTRLHDFRPVYGNLFVCILGRTGSGKSKSQFYLDSLLEQALPYDPKDDASKGALRLKAPASAEALIWAFDKRIEDKTGKMLAVKPMVRGVVDFNELSSLVGRTSRMGSVLAPTLMEFYDANEKIATTSRTHGTESADNAFASCITTSQPESLRELLTSADANSGFLNRWFFAVGKEKTRTAIGGVRVDVTPAVEPLKRIQKWSETVGELQWDQDAASRFTRFFHDKIEPVKKKDARLHVLTRLDLLCKKLILLFAANMQTSMVTEDAVKQMEAMFDYLLECYSATGENFAGGEVNRLRDRVLGFAFRYQKKTGHGPTVGMINKRFKEEDTILLQRTLKVMEQLEMLKPTPSPAGKAGRPAVYYNVSELEA